MTFPGHAPRTILVRVMGTAKLPDEAVWMHERVIKYDSAPFATGPEVEYTLDYSDDGWTWEAAERDAQIVIEAYALRVLAVAHRGWGD